MVLMQLSSVDLPEPDGPMMATNSPGATCMLTFSSAMVRATSARLPRPPYTFVTLRTSSAH